MLGNFLGRVFGTEKALTSIVESVSSGIDALVHTDEEKAQEAAQNRSEARKMVVDWMQATQGQNLARRLIALSITAIWLLVYVVAVVLGMVAVWFDGPLAGNIMENSNQAFDAADSMSGPIMLILSFYFAAPHMGDIAKSVLKGRSK